MLSKEQLKSLINSSMSSLYSTDEFLIKEDVNERSLSHRFAMYLQLEINKVEKGWDVDCEYNRIGVSKIEGEYFSKRLNLVVQNLESDDTKGVTVFPDINVHHRGKEGSEHNLMVIEMKKRSKEDKHDFIKLSEYGKQLGYQWGVYINVEGEKFETKWWHQGEEVKI